MATPTREEIDGKLEASEARTDTKFAKLEGKLDTLIATISGKFDNLNAEIASLRGDIGKSHAYNQSTRWILVSMIVASAFAIAGLGISLATYGDALFSRGMSVRDVVRSVIVEQQDQQRRDTPRP